MRQTFAEYLAEKRREAEERGQARIQAAMDKADPQAADERRRQFDAKYGGPGGAGRDGCLVIIGSPITLEPRK